MAKNAATRLKVRLKNHSRLTVTAASSGIKGAGVELGDGNINVEFMTPGATVNDDNCDEICDSNWTEMAELSACNV